MQRRQGVTTKPEAALILTATEVTVGLADELRHATVAHRDAQEVSQRCAKRWKAALVAAVDGGMSQRTVAELAGISRARLHRIIYEDALQR